jgi:hypothetical protein
MADTTAATGLTVQQWDDQFFVEYFHDGGFKVLMGTDERSVIQVKEGQPPHQLGNHRLVGAGRQ